MSSAPHSNGSGPSNGVDHNGVYQASSSSSSGSYHEINGYAQPFNHNEEIVNHLYHAGWQNGLWADTILHAHQNAYGLHAIILSRSPYLAHIMSTSPPPQGGQRTIYLQELEQEPEVTVEGLAIALGYLYSSVSLNAMRPENARGALAAGCLLGGMDDLCAHAYEACRQSISVETIGAWLEFGELAPPPAGDGRATPTTPMTPVSAHAQLPPTQSIFGPYAQRLREDVFHFLVVQLPQTLGVAAGSGRETLLQVYARVPFALFKAAIESPTFQIGSDQARFKFAKDAIEIRKKGIARGSGAEETVVLAFGGGNDGSSAVHVTRKMRKRPLWKVNT